LVTLRGALYGTPTVAAAKVVVVITGAALIVRVKYFDLCTPVVSVTLAAKVYVPPVVGVPDTTPAAVNATPAGNCPEASAHTYGVVPPVACKPTEYRTLVVPVASVDVVIARGATVDTVSVRSLAVEKPAASAT
jgi:hypothetical protein